MGYFCALSNFALPSELLDWVNYSSLPGEKKKTFSSRVHEKFTSQ